MQRRRENRFYKTISFPVGKKLRERERERRRARFQSKKQRSQGEKREENVSYQILIETGAGLEKQGAFLSDKELSLCRTFNNISYISSYIVQWRVLN